MTFWVIPVGMMQIQILTAAQQVAVHLREEVRRGGLSHRLPGVHQLAAELGVNHKTVAAAIRLLEKQGLLESQGTGRSRRIKQPKNSQPTALRVGILLSDPTNLRLDYMVDLRHRLTEAGHSVVFPPKSIVELGVDVKRIGRMVSKIKADAWVVVSGPHELMEWFAGRKTPTFALFGRRRGFPMAGAGPNKPPAYAAATRALIGLGHQRIVLLARRRRRLPEPGASEQAFLDELAAHGITPSIPYHLPDWEVTVEGFHGCLESLFHITPPTAMIVDEVPFYIAAQEFLAKKRMRVPEEVSLICTDATPNFRWLQRTVAHIRWDSRPLVRRIVRWAANVSRGKIDLRQTLTPSKFVPGGTIGLAKKR